MNFKDMNGMGSNNFSSQKDDFMATYAKYASKRESELMTELQQKVSEMRQNGTLDVQMLEKLYATTSPMLNDIQRQKMRSVIDALKG